VHLTGSVQLIRYADVDAETADILAGGGMRSELGPGQCEVASADEHLDEALAALPPHARVKHLDAGEILIHAGGTAAGAVSPRHLPALFPYVTGVQYEELLLSEGLEGGLPEGTDISATAFGGDDVGPFNVIATAPPLPGEVRADLGEDLVVTWSPARSLDEDAVAAGDLLEVVVYSSDGGPELRCRPASAGAHTIRRVVLDAIPSPAAVAVVRVRRVPFRTAGLQWAELEVAVRHVVTEASP
jgi:hypothetical protein